MEVRTAASPRDVKHYTTDRLREEFLIEDLFQADEIKLVYSHIDRIITGSAVPVNKKLDLTAGSELRAEYFLQRRELGVINIGGAGKITIDGRVYNVAPREGMYIGMGAKDISFESDDAAAPAKFYLNSAPAHTTYPTVLIKREGTPEDGVVIINTARGGLIDTKALISALESGRVGAAGLDVIEDEFGMYYYDLKSDVLSKRDLYILRGFPNVIVTPHMAFYTDQAVSDMVKHSIESCMLRAEGKEDPWTVL